MIEPNGEFAPRSPLPARHPSARGWWCRGLDANVCGFPQLAPTVGARARALIDSVYLPCRAARNLATANSLALASTSTVSGHPSHSTGKSVGSM